MKKLITIVVLLSLTQLGSAQLIITGAPDQVMQANSTIAVNFGVFHPDPTVLAAVTVTASSSNTSLVPNSPSSLSVSGFGGNWNVFITPEHNMIGFTDISVTIDDPIDPPVFDFFTVTVVPEPTTWGIAASLMLLGYAVWRRRSRKNSLRFWSYRQWIPRRPPSRWASLMR